MFDDPADGYDEFVPEEVQKWLDSQRKEMCFNYYILSDGKLKKVSLMEWAYWFNDMDNRRIDYTDISNEPNYPGGKFVSTVCLGLDHDPFGQKPILFESMIFGGKWDQRGWRYASVGEAKQGHWTIVDCVRNGDNLLDVPFGQRPWIELFFEMFDENKDDENEDEDEDEDEEHED
jgi:hypothetical protein